MPLATGKKPVSLKEYVVVAKRTTEEAFSCPRAVEVVSKNNLELQQPENVPQALTAATGVFVQKTNSGGGAPIIRGLVGPQNLILMDGIRINNSTHRPGPTQYLNIVDIFTVKRLEVMRGPGSVLYGSDALGGVIRLFSQEPFIPGKDQFPFRTSFHSRFSSANLEKTQRFSLELNKGNFAFLGGMTYRDFADLNAGGHLSKQPYSAHQQAGWDSMALVRLGRWKLKAAYQRAQLINAGRTDKLESNGTLTFYNNYRDLAYLKLESHFPEINTRLTFTPSYHRHAENRRILKFGDSSNILRETMEDDLVQVMGLTLEMHSWTWRKRLTFTYGLEYYHDFIDSGRQEREGGNPFKILPAAYPSGSQYSSLGGYFITRFRVLSSRRQGDLLLHIGDRVTWFSARAPDIDEFGDIKFSFVGNILSGGVQYLLPRYVNISMNFSQGFRAPNLQQAAYVGDTGKFFQIPNSSLEPERSNTLELTLQTRYKPLALAITYYHSWLSNFIQRVPATFRGLSEYKDKKVYQNINLRKGLINGLECSLRLKLPKGFSLFGNITWTEGNEVLSSGALMPFTRIPPIFGSLTLRYSPSRRYFIALTMLAAGRQSRLSAEDLEDTRIPDGGTPGWVTFTLRSGARLGKHFYLTAAFQNIFDKLYKYHGSGIYAPGFNFIMTLDIKI